MKFQLFLPFLILVIGLGACSGPKQDLSMDRVVIRLAQEPNRLNPVLSRTSAEREVGEYLFLSLADYDPVTLELVPVLLTSLPSEREVKEGNGRSYAVFDMEILPEAVWSDGTGMTGSDLEFTIKMALHPGVSSPGWKQLLNNIDRVEVDEKNPAKFSVWTSGEYFLDKEAILTAEILERKHYDPNDVLGSTSINEMKNSQVTDSLIATNEAFAAIGQDFSSSLYSRENISSSGPYIMRNWESGQFIILERKENWWGNSLDRTYLKANPDQIIFQIVEDNTTALTQLKSGSIDFASLGTAPYQIYDELKGDEDAAGKFNFETADIFRYYYILMNNNDIRLRHKEVRRALSYVLNVEQLINQLEGGYATITHSFIHPSKKEYNPVLKGLGYDISQAEKILDEGGWKDVNGDGIRDKSIDGTIHSLDFRFFITGSSLSQSIATILKEGAAQVGIDIEFVTKAYRNTLTENIVPGDFELTTLSTTQSAASTDPYMNWHSSSIGMGGRNFARFSNARADELIGIIRNTTEEEDRREAYNELQLILLEEQPVLFLYAPMERFVISKRLKPLLSAKRPGYYANAFTLNQ